jgi:hypothetical protein
MKVAGGVDQRFHEIDDVFAQTFMLLAPDYTHFVNCAVVAATVSLLRS